MPLAADSRTPSMRRSRVRRTETGSAIVQGVVGLGIVVGAAVVATLLITNIGTSMWLKNRVGFMAEQAAQYAFGEKDPYKRREFVRQLASEMGLGGRTSSDYEGLQYEGHDAMKAIVTSRISTFGKADWLPRTVKMSDSAVYPTDGAGLQVEGYVTGVVGSVGPSYGTTAVPIVLMTQKKPTFRGVAIDTTNPASVMFWMNSPQAR